jgi:hypothetical protein
MRKLLYVFGWTTRGKERERERANYLGSIYTCDASGTEASNIPLIESCMHPVSNPLILAYIVKLCFSIRI